MIYNPYISFVRVELKVRPFLPSTIIISHCECEERANRLLKSLKNNIPNIDYSYVIDCGSALGVHIGPGSLVVGIQEYIPIKIKS